MRWSARSPLSGYAERGLFFSETIIMNAVTLIGIDLGKHCSHLHDG
jgi:hypothetical protein